VPWQPGEPALRALGDGLFLPDYGNRSLVGFSNFLLQHFGETPLHEPFHVGDSFAWVGKRKKVVVFLLDSLGFSNLQRICACSPYAAQLVEKAVCWKLSTVFPSTTTAALTSFFTGRYPCEHGMLGYILFLKKFSSYVNMIDFSPPGLPRDILLGTGLNPTRFLPVPTLFEILGKKGVKCWSVTSNLFKQSGLSLMHHKGSAIRGYSDMTEMAFCVQRLLQREKGPLFVTVYWGLLDSLAHHYGPDSEEFAKEGELLFRLFHEVLFSNKEIPQPEDTLFFITADHGQIATSWKDESWFVYQDPLISEHLEGLPSGEPRAVYLSPRDAEAFQRDFSAQVGNRFRWLSRTQALQHGLFGAAESASPLFFERVPPLVGLAKGNYSFNFKYSGNERSLKGKHGSVTTGELEIPLLMIAP